MEARDLMTAMNIGKYCMGTIHASTARETIMRLENEPMNVPEVLINLVDVVVIMRRDNVKGGIRRVVGELVETAGLEKKMVLLSLIASFDPATEQFQTTSVSSVYRDRLAQVSGRSPRLILEEARIRGNLLQTLLDKDIMDMYTVSDICDRYMKEPESVFKQLGVNRDKLLHMKAHVKVE